MERKVTLKIKHHFDAAHQLKLPYESQCQNLHGHRWNVVVFIKGNEADLKNGILADFSKIKGRIDEFDHQFLNDLIDANPTAENIALSFLFSFEGIYPKLKFKVRVYESPNCSVEVESDGF